MPDSWIDRYDWFTELTGLPENRWLQQRERSILNPNGDGKTLAVQNLQTGTIHEAGYFETHSIGSLRRVAEAASPAPSTPTSFEVWIREDAASLHCVDVAHLQANATPKSMFQVASNFNAAEAAHRYRYPDSDGFVSFYALDSTQGPAAAASAAVASITRIHAPFYDSRSPAATWGQTEHRQIELLGAPLLRPHFPVTNGKLWFNGTEPTHFNQDDTTLVDSVRVGLHADAGAIFGRRNHYDEMIRVANPPIIDQVFVAALNRRAPHPHPAQLDPKTSFLLRAAYDGTYLAAISRQSSTLYLTLVGGGSFRNPMSLIAQAIAAAHAKWTAHPAAHHLERVILVLYSIGGRPELLSALRASFAAHDIHASLRFVRFREGQRIPSS